METAEFLKQRYSRQALFRGIGVEGQEKIRAARAAVVGLGALGGANANILARAGVGFLRLIDRDRVELSNLQRQCLFTEEDVRHSSPKALAGERYLRSVNSEISIEGVHAEFTDENARELLEGVDIVIDGADNPEARRAVNRACVALRVPWVHGGCLDCRGNIMPIRPGVTPCLACVFGDDLRRDMFPNCNIVGVLGSVVHATAGLEAATALRMIIDPAYPKEPFIINIDVWNGTFRRVKLPPAPSPDCPACSGNG
ncbi:MAG TPA: HesA/MoeB/ThiF family protein [Candidatus Brocadiia bacterium]|nr:HesA/MoeB/ThiF family protein [Candidatus Brocadiia bacterium]